MGLSPYAGAVTDVSTSYRPYGDTVPFRYRMGVFPLDLHDWIEINDSFAADVAEKASRLHTDRDVVVAALDDTSALAAEVLDELVTFLPERFASLYRRDGRLRHIGGVEDPIDLAAASHPIETAGRLVQEDLVLLRPTTAGGLQVCCGSVAFPNRWSLQAKLGLDLTAVHAVVPTLHDELHAPITTFMQRLRPERPFWRLDWGIIDRDGLFQPPGRAPLPRPELDEDTIADGLWVRIERETLRRFRVHDTVLFTLRTYVRPLRWFADHPDDARRLAEALRTMPPEIAAYKDATINGPLAAAWLEQVCGSASSAR